MTKGLFPEFKRLVVPLLQEVQKKWNKAGFTVEITWKDQILESGVCKGSFIHQLAIKFKENNSGQETCLDFDIRQLATNFKPLEIDLESRDFTINSLYYDVFGETLVDPFPVITLS
jgi:Poly A polymerase head domain